MAAIVRIKKRGPLMHLKAYAVDSVLFRTGSANLSPSGLKQQDNDLIILRDPAWTRRDRDALVVEALDQARIARRIGLEVSVGEGAVDFRTLEPRSRFVQR